MLFEPQLAAQGDDLRCALSGISRREFLRSALASSAMAAMATRVEADPVNSAASAKIIDTHVYIGRWPFARLTIDEPAELVALLRRSHVAQAWVGTFDGLLHKDIGGANRRLAETCRGQGEGMLIPFGTVNPLLPDWEEELRRCHEVHHMPGIRLHPNYHGYALADPCFSRLLTLAAQRKLIVQLVAWMENQRHVFLNMRQQRVDLDPLAEAVSTVPELPLVVANGLTTAKDKDVQRPASTGNVYFDFARLDASERLSDVLNQIPANRVLFGSCAPRHGLGTAEQKLHDPLLTGHQSLAIRSETASQLVQNVVLRGS